MTIFGQCNLAPSQQNAMASAILDGEKSRDQNEVKKNESSLANASGDHDDFDSHHDHHDMSHDEHMHDMEDDEDWDRLETSVDSSHGLLSSGGLANATLTPFTSRAHAAAAFGRLAKRAITFGDLIAAVDCFTAAYGQLEQNEQRIVIARMYFLNRQLLYCQHDIIRQKQALAIAALKEAQKNGLVMDTSFPTPTPKPPMMSPDGNDYARMMGASNNFKSFSASSQNFFRAMMPNADFHDGRYGPNTPLNYGMHRSKNESHLVNNMMTPSPVMKPGMPLVTIQTAPRRNMEQNASYSESKTYHHPHHSQHQTPSHGQPVRLDAKHLMLLQYLQNNGQKSDVGVQVSFTEPQRSKLDRQRRMQIPVPPPHQVRGGRRNIGSWWPGMGCEVEDEVMFPRNDDFQQRRQNRGRSSSATGGKNYNGGNWAGGSSTGQFIGGRFVTNDFTSFEEQPQGRSMNFPTSQQQQQQQQNTLKSLYDNSNLLEQLLLMSNFGNQQQEMPVEQDPCNCHTQQTRSNQQQFSNASSQQQSFMMNRPLRRFDNCDIFDGEKTSGNEPTFG